MLNNEQQSLLDLKSDLEEMMQTVLAQLNRAKEVMLNFDLDLARDIKTIEKKINSTELRIDKSCENILALYQPVATDLRLVIATLSINSQLERIADHADGIAMYFTKGNIKKPFPESVLTKVRFEEMFDLAMSMIDDATYGFINEDTKILKGFLVKRLP